MEFQTPSLAELFAIADQQLKDREIPEHLRDFIPLSAPKKRGVHGPINMATEQELTHIERLNALGINLHGSNPFMILGVNSSTTHDKVRSQFRSAVQITHPDRCSGFEDLPIFDGLIPGDAFDRINQAYVQLEKFRSEGRFEDAEPKSQPQEQSTPWYKKLLGTGLVKAQKQLASDDDWDGLALVVNALNLSIDTNLNKNINASSKHIDTNERAHIETEIVHEIVLLQLPKISVGAKKAAIESFEGATATDDTQRRRATNMLAKCLDAGWTVEKSQIYVAIRLYLGRTCDRGTRWY